MVLICDNSSSERALQLRRRVISAGIPCAISSPSSIKDYLPIKLILTFDDTFEEIRRLPYDELFVIAIGDGFINTALNAVGVTGVNAAFLYAQKHLRDCLEVSGSDVFSTGVCTKGIFLGEKFFQIFGNMVIPTDTQYMIFKYLLLCTDSQVFADVDKIRSFCYPLLVVANLSELSIRTQIITIMRKLSYVTLNIVLCSVCSPALLFLGTSQVVATISSVWSLRPVDGNLRFFFSSKKFQGAGKNCTVIIGPRCPGR